MRIRITIDHTVLTAELQPNAATRDLAALLPLSLELSDYHQTEKIAQLPRKLSTAGSPAGFTPVAGDLAFYAPWGNIALFYKDFAYSEGLIKLGSLHGDLGILKKAALLKALLELD